MANSDPAQVRRPALGENPPEQMDRPASRSVLTSKQLQSVLHEALLAPGRADLARNPLGGVLRAGASVTFRLPVPCPPQPATEHDRLLILKQDGPASVYLFSAPLAVNAASPTVMACSVAVPLEVPAELVWREFWKRLAEWLAKRGIAAAGVAALDGPLPIGDLIAIGIGIFTIYEIIANWDELWAAARAAAAVLFAQSAKKKAVSVFEELNIHLARLLRRPVNGKSPDHQGNPGGWDDNHWWGEIKNFAKIIRDLGLSERQLRKLISDAFGAEKVDLVLAALLEAMRRMGDNVPPLW